MFFEMYDSIIKVAEKNPEGRVTPSELTRKLRKQFPATEFVFRTVKDDAVSPDMIVVGGTYDPIEDAYGNPAIEVALCYCPDQQYYFYQLIDWEKLAFDIAECVCHEKIHQFQHRNQEVGNEYVSDIEDQDTRAEQEYLGNDIEIDAYGFSIAAESVMYGQHYTECSMYKVYKKTFVRDPRIIVQLEQNILKYLKYLEINYERAARSTRVARIRYR